jgi:hypothetical protein
MMTDDLRLLRAYADHGVRSLTRKSSLTRRSGSICSSNPTLAIPTSGMMFRSCRKLARTGNMPANTGWISRSSNHPRFRTCDAPMARQCPIRLLNARRAFTVGEYPTFWGGSWHPRIRQASPGAKDNLSFVDGHAEFLRIYWNGIAGSHPADYEPPAAYDYSWDGQ